MITPLYVPGLPVRASGLNAFSAVPSEARRRTEPFWVIPPRVERAPAPGGGLRRDDPDELAAYLLTQSNRLRDKHGPRRGWVDARHVEDVLSLARDHMWPVLADSLFGCELRPVTGLERAREQQRVAGEVGSEWGNGLGIRVRGTDVGCGRAALLPERLRKLTERTGVAPEKTDIVIDLQETEAVSSTVRLAREAWNAIGAAADWRTVVLLSGSFPWGNTHLKDNAVTSLLRVEWTAWQLLRAEAAAGTGPRFVYGDYGTANPRACDASVDDRPKDLHERIRYTTGDSFLVGKGRPWSGEHDSQVHAHAEPIVSHPEFRPDRSEGESWLQRCAADPSNGNPGNPETWATKGYIQHLAFIPDQLIRLEAEDPDA